VSGARILKMNQPKLYLFIGYPGAGKTAIAKIIAKNSDAHHIWADIERNRMFSTPTHSKEESDALYDKLNSATEYLLGQKKSVIFDTNFNYKIDRTKLRAIAKKYKAETVLIWVKTPIGVALDRAVNSKAKRNDYDYVMSAKQFNDIATKLQPPTKEENAIEIDGTEIDEADVIKTLGL
jgi:predicted kinase